MTESHKYHAFISYRHADNKEQGRQWATWLHQAIETYEVPEDLVGNKNGLGEIIPSRIYPIFRDEEELPAHADLGKSIVTALDSTRLLIVLCSPNAVASTYVADEIDYFKSKGGSDRIIAAMLYGEPNTSWDEAKQASGFKAEDECFPVPLQFEYDENGERTDKHAEPIAADFRINNDGQPEQGWTTLEAYRLHLKETTQLNSEQVQEKIDKYEQQKHLMLLKIIAGILGVPLGELTQRDKEYQLEQERLRAKKLRRWLGAVAALAIVAMGAGVFAFFQQQEAVKAREVAVAAEAQAVVEKDKAVKAKNIAKSERDKALITQSNFLIDQARQENKKGNYDRALLLGLNAMPGVYGGERPMPTVTHELRRALSKNIKQVEFVNRDKDRKNIYMVSPDGKTLARTSYSENPEGVFQLISVSSGRSMHVLPMSSGSINNEVLFSPDSTLLLRETFGRIEVWSIMTGQLLYTLDHGNGASLHGVSPDGKFIATSHLTDGSVVIWSANNGEKLQTFDHKEDVRYVAFSPDSSHLVAELRNNKAVVWRVNNGKKLHEINHGSWDHPVFSPDSNMLAIQINENEVQVWSVETGKKLIVAMHPRRINRFTFSPMQTSSVESIKTPFSQSLVTMSFDKTTVFWSTNTGRKLQTLQHESFPLDITFKDDDYRVDVVVTLNNDTAVRWSVETGTKFHTFTHKDEINQVMFSQDGNDIITASKDRTAIRWDNFSGEKKLQMTHRQGVDQVISGADSKTLVTVSNNDAVVLWSKDESSTIEPEKLRYNTFGIFSPSGNLLAASTRYGGIELTSIENGVTQHRLSKEGEVSYLAFDATGRKLAAAVKNKVTVWSIDKEIELYNLLHEETVRTVTFSPDNKTIITISGNKDITLWSAETGEKLKVLHHDGYISEVNFSPNSDKLVSASRDNTAVIWSMPDGERLKTFKLGDYVANAVFTADGTRVLTNTDSRMVSSWLVETGKEETLSLFHRPIAYSSISPNGKMLATIEGDYGGRDFQGRTESKEVKLWSIDDIVERHRLTHEDIVNFAKFSPDGSKLFTSSVDNVAIVWSVENGKKLRTFPVDSTVTHVDFNMAETAITITTNHHVIYRELYLDNWRQRAVKLLPLNRRCLSPDERRKYGLKKLDNNEWQARGCAHFSDEVINTKRLIYAIGTGDIEASKQAIKAGANVHFIHENNSLFALAVINAEKEIISLLLRAGAKPTLSVEEDAILLMKFIDESDEEIVSLLLDAGISPNGGANDDYSPLQAAILADDLDIVSLLVKSGANLNRKNQFGEPIIHQAFSSARHNKNNKIFSLLLEAGADANAKNDNGMMVIEEVLYEGNVDLLKRLIKAGADVNTANKYGLTPLMIAVMTTDAEKVKMLVDAGAEKSYKTSNGKTALDAAYNIRETPEITEYFTKETPREIEEIIKMLK